MGAALNILILAAIALGIFLIAYGAKTVLYCITWVVVGIVNFLRHESMMRPKERYFRVM